MNRTVDTGRNAEDAACVILERKGYRIITRNFAVHNVGELDIVAEKNGDIYIFEVKARRYYRNSDYGEPESAVTASKRCKIFKTTKYLVQKFDLYDRCISYLVISVLFDATGLIQNVEFIPFE
ncbi:MAG: YraN family protein [Clostridia bacterium]|nr:YraN family protein [Clostridia bacterium]